MIKKKEERKAQESKTKLEEQGKENKYQGLGTHKCMVMEKVEAKIQSGLVQTIDHYK